MAAPCFQDSNCIDLSEVAGQLRADVKISPNACNSVTCTPNGLFVPQARSRVTAGIIPAGGGGIAVNLNALAPSIPTQVTTNVTNFLGNASTCFQSGLQIIFAPREVQYQGTVGDSFILDWEVSTNGGPFAQISRIRPRCSATGVIEDWGMSAWTGGVVLAASAVYNLIFRCMVTRIVGTGTLVTPGANFSVQQTTPNA